MTLRRTTVAFAASLLAAAAWAQTSSQPLNLKLPPGGDYPAPAASAAQAAAAATTPPASTPTTPGAAGSAHPMPLPLPSSRAQSMPATISTAPGVYYGDTSGDTGNTEESTAPACDDSTYDKPQVHGSVGVGVVSASHFGTGTYNSGSVSVTQNTGSCDHPTGSMGISIGVSRFGGFGH